MLLMPDPEHRGHRPVPQAQDAQHQLLRAATRSPASATAATRATSRRRRRTTSSRTGIADTAYFGPEAEFYIFDSVRFDQNQYSGYYFLDSVEGVWNSGASASSTARRTSGTSRGTRRATSRSRRWTSTRTCARRWCSTLEQVGIPIEVQHHEVGTAGQAEIDMRFDTLPSMADKLMLYKYVVKNVALAGAARSVTFMPKPIFQDNGSGMHVHQSLWKGGEPLFFDEKGYAGLSDMARWYIGGLLAARAVAARVHQPDDELVQAAGAGLRGAGQPRVLAAQPLGVGAHPARTRRARRRSASSSAAPTRRATRTSRSRRC